MVNERIDAKLVELTRELKGRVLIPGHRIVDAFALRGLDEAGRAGLFAAVLLPPEPAVPELDTLTGIRQALTARLRQLHSNIPVWPIIVQGAPEVVDGETVVPGGPEYFEQLRSELQIRRAPSAPVSTLPVAELPVRPRPSVETLLPPAAAATNGRGPRLRGPRRARSASASRTARARR